MIIYRTATRAVHAADVLDLAVFNSHEKRRSFLIHFGELEAALVDEGCGEAIEEQLREVSVMAGRLFCSYDAATEARLRERVRVLPLPARPVKVSVPEGYAYYGLFPETYAESAIELFKSKRPDKVVCIGIRSIGSSLSAVVAAQLERLGCRVRTWTVRPGGHPFDRRLQVSTDTETAWKAWSDATFAIVDEGPGLSGSTFAAVADTISGLGVADDHICFLPAWDASADCFRSERARRRWLRHDRYTAEPQPPCGTDISAGKWRRIIYAGEHHFPDVQPQHEARKFLCAASGTRVLRKFEGLGVYGELKLDVARQLANAGFSPPVLKLENGYLVMRFVPGRPVRTNPVDRELLDTMARYLAFRHAAFPRYDATPTDELCRMIEHNSGVRMTAVCPHGACLVDGRMLPHEWIDTGGGYMKVDALDHGDSHFYPGPIDIAWDLAGAITEFRLKESEREHLLDAYAQCASDWTIRERLPFYTTAYLAFRLGYTSMNGFDEAAGFYRNMLSERQYAIQ